MEILKWMVGAAILIVGVLSALRRDKEGRADINPRAALVPVLLLILYVVFLAPAFGTVPAGHRGVVLRFGAVSNRVLGEGLYMVVPFIETVEKMDVQVHAEKAKAAAASRDLQNVSTEVTLNYRLDPSKVATIYRDLRRDYIARIIEPSIQEGVKSATAQFDAEELIVKRASVKQLISEYLDVRLKTHGIGVDAVSITDFQFSDEFSRAVEAKVTASQQALKAQNDLRRIQVEAEQRITGARAEAEAIRIQAQSINAQGGAEYVRLKAIEKWNGVLPQWVSSGAPVPVMDVFQKH